MIYVSKLVDEPVKTEIAYKSDAISFKMHDAQVSVKFADLAKRDDFGDFSYYGIHVDRTDMPRTPERMDVVNIHTHSKGSKTRPGEVGEWLRKSFYIQVFVPHAGVKSFDECDVIFYTSQALKINVEATEVERGSGFRLPTTKLKLTAPDSVRPDGVMEIDVRLLDANDNPIERSVEVYLEATAGYLSKRRITLDKKGKGTFRMRADLLTAGDAIKVKAGYKHFTGLAETTVKVA